MAPLAFRSIDSRSLRGYQADGGALMEWSMMPPLSGAAAFPVRTHHRVSALLAGLAVLLFSTAAFAQAGEPHHEEIGWTSWEFEPEIFILALLACLIYAAGIVRRPATSDRLRLWRHAAFFGGVAAVFVSLESPIDAMADHLFWMHQIQHMLLRMIGPMLIALAAPQAMLISGLPSALRRGALAPFAGSGALRQIFSFLINATVVTALFIAALYVWQYPPYHNAAILNDGIHYTMHVTMLAAGLLFWWRIFDMRPPPMGLGYGTRLMMLWIATLAQIGLGAYTTLKSEVLYPAYDVIGRLFDVNPLTDETIGGFIIWVPSSMMCLLAAILVIHLWGVQETRADEKRLAWSALNSAGLRYPTTGAELVAQARPKNRILAIGVIGFAISMFGLAIFIGVLNHLNGETRGGLLAHVVPHAAVR
jgi:putative membrane protein